ncbi:MAG: hypothetical protein ACOCQG_04130 [Candidatus Nanoarchaeia archaeon]
MDTFILIAMLPAILILGSIITYTDTKYGKIPNKCIFYGLLYGGGVLFIAFIYTALNDLEFTMQMTEGGDEFSFFFETLVNFLLASLIGILFWSIGSWCAADAKLFMAFALLTPVFIYEEGYIRYFPSLAILINTFTVVLIVCGFELLRSCRRHIIYSTKELFSKPREILLGAAIVFIITWAIRIPFSYLGIKQGILETLLVLLIVIKIFGAIIQKLDKYMYIGIGGLCVLRILLDNHIFSLDFLRNFGLLLLFFVFIRLFLQELAEEAFSSRINITGLKRGMIITDHFVKDKTHDNYFWTKNPSKNEKIIFSPKPEGIGKKEATFIKKLYKKGLIPQDTLRISSNLYFGPYIFAGTIMALLFKGHIIVFVLNLMN